MTACSAAIFGKQSMSSTETSLTVFACVLGGALLGVLLRSTLPAEHLRGDSKDVIRLGMGLVGTIAALVLGLLVASAKGSYDAQSNEVTQLAADVGLLDRILAHYGPEAKETRDQLRSATIEFCDRMWPKDGSGRFGLEPVASSEALYDSIQRLSPKSDEQRSLHAAALSRDCARASALVDVRTEWQIGTFDTAKGAGSLAHDYLYQLRPLRPISFGLFAPRNATVLASLFVSALSVSCAVLLIVDLYQPFEGLMQIPSGPLREVLVHLAQ